MNELTRIEKVDDEVKTLPPMMTGHDSKALAHKVDNFYSSVAMIFEAWVQRSKNPNTQRAYRRDVLSFIEFLGLPWPERSELFLKTSVADVRNWHAYMDDELDMAPMTLNRRLSALSNFYSFLREIAAVEKLPVMIHNPAHKDFIKRPSAEAVNPTREMTALTARKLMGLPGGESVLEYRDRAILKFYLFTACRIGTGCRLLVSDFHHDPDDPTLKIQEKGHGKRKRVIGIHPEAAEAIQEYLDKAELASGPLFRARLNPKSRKLGREAMSLKTMYRVLMGYLEQLPKAMVEVELTDGSTKQECIYSPHSLRATAATILLDAGVDITKVKELLGHSQIKTTQIYDKRRRTTKDSASRDLAF